MNEVIEEDTLNWMEVNEDDIKEGGWNLEELWWCRYRRRVEEKYSKFGGAG